MAERGEPHAGAVPRGSEAGPTTRGAALAHALQPSERQVIELVLASPAAAIEWTAQEVAERAGVGRTTVLRACQSLGYRGYPQLRVALAAELGAGGLPSGRGRGEGQDDSLTAFIAESIAQTARGLHASASLLDERATLAAVRAIIAAGRLLVVANGLSAAVATVLSMRLTSHGRPAEFIADSLAQQISARHLRPDDVCVVVSGSGANDTTLAAAAAAGEAGATVIAITSFAQSALTAAAELSLIVASPGTTFRGELEHASRVSLMLFAETLVQAVVRHTGDAATSAHTRTLRVISEHLQGD